MKPIKLKIEQEEKLLEMAHSLFPGDYFSFQNDSGEDGIMDRNFIWDNQLPKKPKTKQLSWEDEGSHFHWYEFCVEHLSRKITGGTYGLFRGMAEEKMHMVDYLYKQFKRL